MRGTKVRYRMTLSGGLKASICRVGFAVWAKKYGRDPIGGVHPLSLVCVQQLRIAIAVGNPSVGHPCRSREWFRSGRLADRHSIR